MLDKLACVATASLMASMLASCADDGVDAPAAIAPEDAMETAIMIDESNPFLAESTLDLRYPRFDLIEERHYLPAFEAGMQQQLEEVRLIAGQSTEPTFDNTLVPLELSGQMLDRVSAVFFAMTSAHTNDTISEIQTEIAPRLSAHRDEILLNAALFERLKTLYDRRAGLGLDPEALRLVEETYRDFVRAGALLIEADKDRLRAINSELAELQTRFNQNVLKEVNELAVVVDSREELAGLSEAEIEGAAQAAEARDLRGKYVIPLLNTTQQPSLSSLENRALRRRILEASESRGSRGGEFDNRGVLSRTARLRAERARLLGYDSHAAYVLDEQTAKTVPAVNDLLSDLTPAAVANARTEAEKLQAMIDAEGGGFELAAWDWDFYADRVRRAQYAFDAAELKPYFELDAVLRDGVFFAAGQIYGLRFEERFDLPVYHDDVRVFEVFEEDGTTLSLFIFDPHARPSKRGGAWASRYVSQSDLLGTKSVTANHINIPKPPAGEPTLLTFDEVNTLFHEFGHALHGMFSDVTYPSFSGTRVPRDFVEYPSQVNEMWATWPEVLANYARHYETGEAMPAAILEKVLESQKFNQGYATTEYLAATITDLALHELEADDVPSADGIMQFEADALAAAGADLAVVPPRYHLPYFSHIMGGYSAGYYSYIWSEVLDADTVEWFKENGGMLRENGQHFRDTLLSRGGSVDAMSLYRDFRGRDPVVAPLLERRGLN